MAKHYDMSRFDGMKRREQTVPTDNGQIHYGSGLKGSLCGVEDPSRREQSNWIGVTCVGCLRQGNRGSRAPSDGAEKNTQRVLP